MPTAGGCVRKSTLATVGAEGRGGGWDAPDTSYGRHRDKGTADVAGRLALRTGDLYIDDDRGNRQRTVSGHEDHACRPLTAASGSACIASDSGIGGHKPRLGRAHHSVDSGFPGSLPLVASPTSLVTKGLEREGQRSAGFRRCLNRPAVQGQIGGESVVGVGRAASSR
ncbi:unnamed protein product, partial [Sphacelaria rigidula]